MRVLIEMLWHDWQIHSKNTFGLKQVCFFKGMVQNTQHFCRSYVSKYIKCLAVNAAKSSTSYYIHYILFPPLTVNIYTIWSRRTWKHIIIYALCVQADCCLCLSGYFTLIANINTFPSREMSRQNNMQRVDSLDTFNVQYIHSFLNSASVLCVFIALRCEVLPCKLQFYLIYMLCTVTSADILHI